MYCEPFTYDYYRKFLYEAAERSLVTSLKGTVGQDNFILLRHDVDFSFEYAHQLFQVEREFNITSTYFFLVTGYSYNILNSEYRKGLKEMVSAGFEIGLHFDPTVYPDLPDDELTKKCYFEKSILEEIIEEEVVSVSLHNPSVHGNYVMFDKMLNAYDPDIFCDAQYLSDSCFSMRGKDMLDFVSQTPSKKQVLIHPMHWHENKKTYHDVFAEHIRLVKRNIHKGFSVNRTYLAELEQKRVAL
jgi:hypothetical protein